MADYTQCEHNDTHMCDPCAEVELTAAVARGMRCPTSLRWMNDITGCGSDRLIGPHSDGTYDCLDCGLFFTEDSAEAAG